MRIGVTNSKEWDIMQKGITRRDLLKIMGAGTFLTMMPTGLGADKPIFNKNNGLGLIFLVGDGMPTGVIRGMHEISTTVFENPDSNIYSIMKDPMSATGYMGTKSLTSIVTDSASASAAWATGVKTANRMLSTLPDGRPLKTIMEILKEEGYGCGFVTTTRVTHATPAAWISHRLNRDDEDGIALDYLSFLPDVILGGGTRHFEPSGRKDKKNLFDEFTRAGYEVFRKKDELLSYNIDSSKKLLGTFNPSHMSYYLDRINNPCLGKKEPSLHAMTGIALQRLSRNPKGFILQVEAGRIDHANHSNDAWSSLMDMYEMDLTLGVIREFISKNPRSLLIIVSDHGNAGWGINGTGAGYKDSTEALKKYTPIKASFEIMGAQMRGKTLSEIKSVFEHYTTMNISDAETNMIYESIQPGYRPYPGDFGAFPDVILGRILSHSEYKKGGNKVVPVVRRGNVGFTSTSHTAEDQLVVAFGQSARQLGMNGYIENTDLFKIISRYFGVKYKNPAMTAGEAEPLIKAITRAQWERHMKLHVS